MLNSDRCILRILSLIWTLSDIWSGFWRNVYLNVGRTDSWLTFSAGRLGWLQEVILGCAILDYRCGRLLVFLRSRGRLEIAGRGFLETWSRWHYCFFFRKFVAATILEHGRAHLTFLF